MTHTPLPRPAPPAPGDSGRSEAEGPAPLVALAAGLIAQGGSDATVGVRALLRHVQTHDPDALERMVAELHLRRLSARTNGRFPPSGDRRLPTEAV